MSSFSTESVLTSQTSSTSYYSTSSSKSSSSSTYDLFAEFGSITDDDPLSLTKRAVTCVLEDEDTNTRFVVRISNAYDKSSERILAFGEYWFAQQHKIHGLVPMLSPPQVTNSSVIEKYSEVLFDPLEKQRLDFQSFCVSFPLADRKIQQRAFGYLYDIAHAISDLHYNGWAHLDLSLENVALGPEQAFLIDFESSLPFSRGTHGLHRRGDLNVPVKMLFVPLEHHTAKSEDLVSLRAYDVWAFGNMVFAVLFGCYLLPTVRGSDILEKEPQKYFVKHGFERFCEKYHRHAYEFLFRSNLSSRRQKKLNKKSPLPFWAPLAEDLLSGIFILATRRIDIRTGVSRFEADSRFTARQIYDHCFWTAVGCSSHKSIQKE